MRTILVAVLTSAVAFAESPKDAPLADLPGRSVRLAAGQAAPFPGRLLADAEHRASEAVCADDHAFRERATKDDALRLTPLAVVAIVAGALAVGAATATAVVLVVR